LFRSMEDRLSELYARAIGWSLNNRGKVLAIAFASFVGALALAGVVGAEFVPQADMSRLQIRFDTPEGASLDYTDAKLRQVETALKEFPEILEVYASVNVGGAMGKNAVNMDLRLQPRQERARSLAQMTPVLRERITRIAGINLKGIVVPGGPGAGQKPIYLSIQGGDFHELQRIADQVMAKLGAIRGVVELDSSLKASRPTLSVDIDRDLASRVGLSVASIGQALRPLIAGDAASAWLSPEGDSYDVNVRLAASDRDSRDELAQLPLASQGLDASGRPTMIPLQQVATLREGSSPSQINRRSLFREVAITASLDGRPLGEVSSEIKAITAGIELPPGYRFDLGGASKDMAESAGYAGSALLLAVIFIYMVLASQFGSLIQPLAIMSSLPLSLIGVMTALLVTGSTLSIFSVIGVIMLMGLVTKNAILLVDFVIRARADGMDRRSAIIEAGRVRLRPILMTTSAMVFGMLPLALSVGDGSESRAPMAHAIIGGVITSTLLTLLVVPVIYTLLDDGMQRLRRRAAG
ncbi:MAG: efflux RND transporter permease subunit, partial [Zoogloea sp.]|nr:efflux RND transporter permease subunit [Zoogloea sp.]